MQLDRRAILKGGAAMTAFMPFFSACAPRSAIEANPTTGGFIDGVRQAELIAAGDMTSLEATELAIARTEAVNPKINAVATYGFEAARERAGTNPSGAFGGVPTFIKDLADWRGLQTLFGSRAFKGNIPDADGPLSEQWRELGLVPIGKSTSPEMGLISSTEPIVTGATRNPWNLDHIPGGSSGGAAALTAARVVPFAHASDEPPGIWSKFHGLRVAPVTMGSVDEIRPISGDVDFPIGTSPNSRHCSDSGPSASGILPLNARLPNRVCRPRQSARSFMKVGTPPNAPDGLVPARSRAASKP
ncbi:MAG: amidase family protein [Pseudomonadota bacterium]